MHGVTDRRSTADREHRRAEHGEESLAGVVDLAALEAREFASHRGSVLVEELSPAVVTKCDHALGGARYIDEQQRQEGPLWNEAIGHLMECASKRQEGTDDD